MLSDEAYDLCLPVLQDAKLDDDDKTEQLEELLKVKQGLNGKALENAVLDALWRHKSSTSTSSISSPPPVRHTVVRRASPAPWQLTRATTPSSLPGLGTASPAFTRTKSSTASPFTSPRASPRMAHVALHTSHIPHSPRLDAYQFSEPSPTASQNYPDFDTDSVEWLVNDETGSTTSSLHGEGSLNGGAPEYFQPQTLDPYDMLRLIIKEDRSDEDLEKALQENGYDMSATMMALMGAQELPLPTPPVSIAESPNPHFLVGKSMSPAFRPSTPIGQQKSHILCKYYLANGSCARADCRFSHDASKVLCKYFLSGSCLAGDSCIFSHDPSLLMQRVKIETAATPPLQYMQPNFQITDYEAFPTLQPGSVLNSFTASGYDWDAFEKHNGSIGAVAPPPGFNPLSQFAPNGPSRPHSRPGSRHTSRAPTPSVPAVDDAEAFPSLGSAAAAKGVKKHHGKRGGHGHAHKESPSTLAEVVRMSPSPGPVQLRKGFQKPRGYLGREVSSTSTAIPPPEHIPWLATGDAANSEYLKARAIAIKHGTMRNKFLQSAAQAYNRNDSRAAKALSLRGQTENNHMREAHREAARALYETRNRGTGASAEEVYVDLHGLHPEEAVSYLFKALKENESPARNGTGIIRPVYAITGTGHHSRNGKDKIGKAIRTFLAEYRYAFREFSVPGDRNSMGGIIGIDPGSYDRSVVGKKASPSSSSSSAAAVEGGAVGGESTKVRLLRKEDIDAEAAAVRTWEEDGDEA